MSEQALDLRRSLHVAWRHKTIVGIVAALGFLLGAGYASIHPSMLTARTLVVLPQNTPNMATEVVVAGSDPVLNGAMQGLPPGTTIITLRNTVQARSVTPTVISFTARARTAAVAEATANAVAASYLAYIGSSTSPVGHVAGRVLSPAVIAVGTSPVVHLLSAGLIGAIAGTVVGIIVVLATRRNDRALRERDQIANAIGVPSRVLALSGAGKRQRQRHRRRHLTQRDFPLLRQGSARSRSATGRIRRLSGHPHHPGHRSAGRRKHRGRPADRVLRPAARRGATAC